MLNSLVKTSLFLTIFLLPLTVTYKGYGYEHIKVLFFILSITLIGFLLIGKTVKWTLISKAAGLFILTLLLTSLLGIDPKTSLLGNYPYFQGWILYSYFYLFYLMIKTFRIELKTYALILSISSLLVSLLAIKDWVLINLLNSSVPTYAGRVVSTFGQPNFYAGFLLLTLPFSYLLFKNSKKKLQLLGWVSGIISFGGIMVSYSRSTILLALILLILGLIDQLKIKKILIVVFGVIISAMFLSINLSSGFVWKEFLLPTTTQNPDLTKESVESRVYIWPQALKIALEKPLTGYGLENISQAFSGYFQKYKYPLFEANLKISPILISLKDLTLDRSHNYILDLLFFSGILGLLSWILLVGLVAKSAKNKLLLIGLITYLVWIQFQNQSIVQLMYFWLITGLIDQSR